MGRGQGGKVSDHWPYLLSIGYQENEIEKLGTFINIISLNLEGKGVKITIQPYTSPVDTDRIPLFRGEFLKQNCPVSTCALTNDRNKKESADLILFKVLTT